jgi:hypothetical protein
MKCVLSIFLPNGKKVNAMIYSNNIPAVAKELKAEVIGQGGVIVAIKASGDENFTFNED